MESSGDLMWLGAEPSTAQVMCVFVHGRGQSPEEMNEAVIRHLTVSGVAYALPRAASRSWYAARAIDPLIPQTRDELSYSLEQLRGGIAAARAKGPGRPLVLGGFSQGACLSIEHVASGRDRPDALVAFTGCRVGVPADGRPSASLGGLPVYLTGGDSDPWIPVAAFAEAAGEFGRMGASLRADVFPGRAHEVSKAEIAMFNTILSDLSTGHAPEMRAPR
jgi:phospholipase/carboxylesterase